MPQNDLPERRHAFSCHAAPLRPAGRIKKKPPEGGFQVSSILWLAPGQPSN
jgi:hypothetical protein